MRRMALFLFFALTGAALADPPVVKDVTMRQFGNLWTFDVTVLHGDTGWDDYADGWRILDQDGRQLGLRNLAHPHVNEQPFTRSLSGVQIPSHVTAIGIQTRDSIGGWSPRIETFTLDAGPVVRFTR